jgi:hypothetical protein
MVGSRRGWSHGVQVRRRATNGPGDRRAGQVLFRRSCIRYEDDRKVCFVPEAGEEFFSQDDAHRLVCYTRVRKSSSGVLAHRRGTPVRDRTTPAPSDLWGCLILAVVGLPGQQGKEP